MSANGSQLVTVDILNKTLDAREKRMFRAMADMVTQILSHVVTKEEAKNFATKDDLAEVKDDIRLIKETMATKEELEEVKQDVKKMKRSMVTKSDIADLVGEVQTMREELTVVTYQVAEVISRLDDHEKRMHSN